MIENAFSPLITLFEAIMVFIHDNLVGGSWGLAIVGLTVLIRAVLVPLTFRQLKSMQEMQRLAPQIKALKEKYKDDKQRQQQEIMKFYQENKINPLASCLPLLLQLPVFISLFYMLRTDLKKHICGDAAAAYYIRSSGTSSSTTARSRRARSRRHERAPPSTSSSKSTPCQTVAPHSAKFLFLPDITEQGDRRRADRPDRALRRLAARLDADRDGDRRPEPAPADAAPADRLRRDPLPLPGRPARLLDHDEPVDDRPAVR